MITFTITYFQVMMFIGLFLGLQTAEILRMQQIKESYGIRYRVMSAAIDAVIALLVVVLSTGLGTFVTWVFLTYF